MVRGVLSPSTCETFHPDWGAGAPTTSQSRLGSVALSIRRLPLWSCQAMNMNRFTNPASPHALAKLNSDVRTRRPTQR